MKRLIAIVCAVIMCSSLFVCNADVKISAISEATENITYTSTESNYTAYLLKYNNFTAAKSDIIIDAASFVSANGVVRAEGVASPSGTVLTDSGAKSVASNAAAEYVISVPEDGLYNFSITYCPLIADGTDLKIGVMIDGEYPFSIANGIKLPRFYKDKGEVRVDNFGNQSAPQQEEVLDFARTAVCDVTGVENFPLQFALSKGAHKITLIYKSADLYIANLGFTAPEIIESYDNLKNSYSNYSSAKGKPIIIEGEKPYLKNSRSLVAKSDGSSPEVTPSSSKNDLCNIIGGSNWKTSNDEIIWKFTVENDGLYKIGMNVKQDLNMNLYSYRYLRIDGKTPFDEATCFKFGYDTGWNFIVLSDADGNPYQFYLDKGEHTISLSVTLGDISGIYKQLEETADILGNLYLDITMITSSSPDKNRDYELHKQIPGYLETLDGLSEKLGNISKDMTELSDGKTNSFIAAVNNMLRVVNSMRKNYYESQIYLSDYYNNYSTVTAWLYDMKSMSLSVDQIQLCPVDENFDIVNANFFEKLGFTVKKFFASFSSDYTSQDFKGEGKVVELWVNWGRDQAMVLQNLINETFTPQTGIEVNLKITAASLIKGMLSNNAPDVSLHLARTEPVNLAMRGALYDLTEFSDYEEVMKNFGESTAYPYTYNGGVYALPDTQSFYLMFCRKDILDKLDLEIPETWDDFLATVNVLQINNMNAWIPYIKMAAASTVNTGVGGLNLYATILQQYGGSFYNEEKTKCMLDTPIAFRAFETWTEMYTKYKLPEEASFYNRFRTGTMPLGIETYTMYTTLMTAAPEISGKWGIALVPGVKQSDGTINHTVSGAGTGCSILKDCEDKDSAWEFLKWWVSADTQLRYNNEVEAILGTVSRVATANLEAFSKMSWADNDVEILLQQKKNIREIPELPGSYYVSRSVDQAFWSVIHSNQRPKDMLTKWNEIANSEIERKIAEYSN